MNVSINNNCPFQIFLTAQGSFQSLNNNSERIQVIPTYPITQNLIILPNEQQNNFFNNSIPIQNQNTICESINYNINNNIKKTRVFFTKEEDDKIKALVQVFGTKKWTKIASFIAGRTSKQCRDRYLNYLVPGYFNGEWSKEEDELLLNLYKQYGSKWTIIQRSFQDRSANAIKNRWNYFLSRQKNDNPDKHLTKKAPE